MICCSLNFTLPTTTVQIGEKRAALRGFRRLQNSLKPPEGEVGEEGGSGIGGDYLRAAKGPCLNDVCRFCVCILTRSIVQNSRNLPSSYGCIWVTPSPSHCGRHLSVAPKEIARLLHERGDIEDAKNALSEAANKVGS